MARIPPDTNDGYVWLLDETSGVYKNTGSILAGSASTDLSVSGTIIRTGTGVFGGNCPYFPGAGNYPSGASSTRNYIFGAENINTQPPFTISFWVNLRSYLNNSNFQQFVKKLFRQHTTTNTWAAPFFSWEVSNGSGNSGQDVYFGCATSPTAQTSKTVTDFPIPLHQWCHIGFTHDGTAMRSYLNGCLLLTYSGATQLQSTTMPGSYVLYNDVSYAITSSTGTYVSGVTDIGNHGDEVMTTVALPFPVTVWGITYNSVNASSNGFVEFGQSTNAFNFSLPNSSLGATINVCERDTTTSGTGLGIFTTTVGSSPNRTFVIEWRMNSLAGGTLNAEIKFFEGSTTFETLYTTSTSTNTVSIGIQSAAGGKTTVFSNSTTIPAANTRLIFTATSANPGALVIGATPLYLVTSSPTKEEANFSVQDLRIANVVRSLDYFKTIYRTGTLPLNLSTLTQYYKLRAYDTSCDPPQSVVWVDTQISLANAPAFPCGGPYSTPEVLDTWYS